MEPKPFGIIYLIWNKLNGKKYIGQTKKKLKQRIAQHMKKKNSAVGAAIRKYGLENFICGVVETCETQEQINERERYYIAALHCKVPFGYNRTDGGEGSKGYSPTEEQRARLREVNLGKKHSKESCAKISAKNKGQKRTPEQCANISAGKMGHEVPEEVRAKLRAANLGKKAPLETRLKMSEKSRNETPYKNLLSVMNEQQISCAALAEVLSLTRNSVLRKIRGGDRDFTTKDISKLTEHFNLPAEYLMQRI